MSFISEYATFLKEVHRTFYTTGAVLPSGRQLAKAVTVPLKNHARPVRVLEVGPGTGAVTQEIVKHIQPGDTLDLVELNDRFVEMLHKRFQTEPNFKRVAGQSNVLHLPLQEVRLEQPYDIIISGLPVNNFSSGLVRELMRHMFRLLKPDGTLSFFEYLAIRRMKTMVMPKASERRRLARVDRVLKFYLEHYEFRCDTIWINFPPALVHHLQRDTAEGSASRTAS